MARQEFADPGDDLVHESELADVLQELHQEDFPPVEEVEPADPTVVTVAAIAEVTGKDPAEILKTVQAVRRRQREEATAHGLAEAEEPLYRVERPSTKKRSKSRQPLSRSMAANKLLDSLEQQESQRVLREIEEYSKALKDKNTKQTESKKADLSTALLYVLVFLVTAILVFQILSQVL